MPKFQVDTRAVVTRHYIVDAESDEAARTAVASGTFNKFHKWVDDHACEILEYTQTLVLDSDDDEVEDMSSGVIIPNGVQITQWQRVAVEFILARHNQAVVAESAMYHATRNVVITGLVADIEMCRWTVSPQGTVVAVAWKDHLLGAYMTEIGQIKSPSIAERGEEV